MYYKLCRVCIYIILWVVSTSEYDVAGCLGIHVPSDHTNYQIVKGK